MSHELSIRQDGRAEMAFVGATPWHGLGQELQAGAPIEEWAQAAGMDWEVASSPVRYEVGGKLITMKDRVVLHRSDSNLALGVVSTSYNPVQPGEVLEFFRDLTDAAGFQLETAGTLFGGKRLWALASIGAEAAIADPADKVKGYLLLSTACDGSMVTEARYTTVRVVCNNTLGFARDGAAPRVKVSHRSTFEPDAVKRELGIEAGQAGFANTMDHFRRMAETPITLDQVIEATAELFRPGFADLSRDEQKRIVSRPSTPIEAVGKLALDRTAIGSGLAGTDGTVWGWLNSVTQWVDHDRKTKTPDRRLNSAWFGKGATMKQAAFEKAVEMVMADGSTRTVFIPTTLPQIEDAEPVGLLDEVLALTPAI